MRCCVVLAVLAACGKHEDPPPGPPPPQAPTWTCESLPFAASTPVPEASGAAWTEYRGKPALFVISDSGNKGAWGLVDPDSGDTLVRGQFEPLDHGDDYEGVATRRGQMWAVVSNGRIGTITRDGETFRMDNVLHPLGGVISDAEEPPGHGTKPPKGSGMACEGPDDANCGRNFEGICLDDRTPYARGPCAGFGAAKADGKLYCLIERDDTYIADINRWIQVTKPGVLADCAIGEDGTLWAGGNIFDGNTIYRVEHWENPLNAKVVVVGQYGIGNSEVLAVRGDVIYRMSDLNNAPSLMAKFRCTAASR